MINLVKLFLNNILLPKSLHTAFDSGDRRQTTIVLLHGIAATSKTWDALIKELDIKKYGVISMDWLGFSKSPKPSNCEYSANDHIKYIYSTIKR